MERNGVRGEGKQSKSKNGGAERAVIEMADRMTETTRPLSQNSTTGLTDGV